MREEDARNQFLLILRTMQIFKEIGVLLSKELKLEWRNKYAISGILLYVGATVFIVFMAFVEVEPNTWVTLYWVIMLFASVNAVTKSFTQESKKRQLYFYTLVNPIALLLSKIIYNTLLLLLIGFLIWGGLSLFVGNAVLNARPFLLAIGLGSLGFSVTFTFVSAISAKTDNSATLMAILSFPLVIPILITLVSLSKNAIELLAGEGVQGDVTMLIAIDLMVLGMSLLLYPFLWRD